MEVLSSLRMTLWARVSLVGTGLVEGAAGPLGVCRSFPWLVVGMPSENGVVLTYKT